MEIPTQSIIHTTQSEKVNMQQVEVLHNTHPKMNMGPQKRCEPSEAKSAKLINVLN